MSSLPADERPPLTISGVLGDTFALIANRVLTIIVLAVITIAPTRLLTFVLVEKEVLPFAPGQSWVTFGLGLFAISGLASLMLIIGQGAMVGTALARRDGSDIGLLGSVAWAVKRLHVILPVALLYSLGFWAGCLLLLIPGLILITMWAVVGPVAAAERTNIADTFRRSQVLSQGVRWRIFGLLIVLGVGTSAANWIAWWLARPFVGASMADLTYSVEPKGFIVSSLISLLIVGFSLAMHSALYIALIERRGDGPLTARLNRIFE